MTTSDYYLAVLEALAAAIDAKDQTSPAHIRRIRRHAVAVGRALRMSDRDLQGLEIAATLHDIGKLAVPEHVLSKPGMLTPEEFQKIRTHPKVGADIISAVPFPYPVSPLILCHHERWDGKGYPIGLKGEDIPLGSRILSVVDYFDALMTERPYHKALSQEAAVELLLQESGNGLDPGVVSTFLELLPRLSAEDEAQEPAAGPGAGPAPAPVFDDIGLAHREIHGLYEISQAMGSSLGVADTMAIIAAKLPALVPFSCCALFIYDEETETLRCRFASGLDADLIQQVVVRGGEGLTGWVARNRRPLVNARPSADLEAAEIKGRATSLQSALVVPLEQNETFIGALAVYHREPDFYRDDHRRLLDRVSEQAAAVIRNSIDYEQAKEDALTDGQTGLPNRRFLFMHVTDELARAGRVGAECALVLFDIEDRKRLKVLYGRQAGERALLEVASVLRAALRPGEVCARHEDSEFVLVASGCGWEEVERRRREIQRAVASLEFDARPGERVVLTLSAGAALFPRDGSTWEEVMTSADRRLQWDRASRIPV